MRLSDAMRKGAKISGQAFGAYADSFKNETCAVGAIILGFHGEYSWTSEIFNAIIIEFSNIFELAAKCPADKCIRFTSVIKAIMRLNDTHKWSRQRIADWLEEIEIREENKNGNKTNEDRKDDVRNDARREGVLVA